MIVLEKKSTADFVILNLTDPQLSDEEWTGDDTTNRSILTSTVTELVQRVKPDLITVTGDLAWAGHFTAHTMLGSFLDSFGIPWAPVWGNHDQQDGMDYIERVVAAYRKYPNFVYESGDPVLGNGNYVIGISEQGKLLAGVVMMDSHDNSPYINEDGVEVSAWAKLSPTQLQWYQTQIEGLSAMGCQQTILMTHIPIHAYRLAFEEWTAAPNTQRIGLGEPVGDAFGNYAYLSPQGDCYEMIGSYPADEGMFSMIQALGSTRIVLAGHDHVNNTMWDYRGVKLVYSLKTGPGCYWRESMSGGTVISLSADGSMDVHHEYVSF